MNGWHFWWKQWPLLKTSPLMTFPSFLIKERFSNTNCPKSSTLSHGISHSSIGVSRPSALIQSSVAFILFTYSKNSFITSQKFWIAERGQRWWEGGQQCLLPTHTQLPDYWQKLKYSTLIWVIQCFWAVNHFIKCGFHFFMLLFCDVLVSFVFLL